MGFVFENNLAKFSFCVTIRSRRRNDHGGMGRDFKEDAVVEPNDIKMHLMSVWKIANGLMIVTGGSFIPPEPFDIEKLQAGPLGYWKPAVLPESPEDVCELFS